MGERDPFCATCCAPGIKKNGSLVWRAFDTRQRRGLLQKALVTPDIFIGSVEHDEPAIFCAGDEFLLNKHYRNASIVEYELSPRLLIAY